MALFQRRQVASQPERRNAKRYAVDCPASLQLLGGEYRGRLVDLSIDGARLEVAEPPGDGVSGLLVWGDQDAWCRVVWSKGTDCGLVFERSIPLHVVEQTQGETGAETGPVANFSNIPLGQKRSRRASLVSKS